MPKIPRPIKPAPYARAKTVRPGPRRDQFYGAPAATEDDLKRIMLMGPTLFRGQPWNEQAFNSNPDSRAIQRWSRFQYRLLRYAVYWAVYEQNLYREINLFSDEMKEDRKLYSAIRTIVSPGYRIGEFWAEHIYSGILDDACGDGSDTPTAIPIITENEPLRELIANIFRVSNMQTAMGLYTRYGAVCGDVGLAAVDDPARMQVYIKPLHPRIIREARRDPQGNVKNYIFSEPRDDPTIPEVALSVMPQVMYTEICTRIGESVHYETFLNGTPYDWRVYEDGESEIGPEWTEPYGFVPFVMVQHRDMGLGWGWAEMHPTLSKLMELDETGSKMNDQISKIVNTPWLFSGMQGQDDTTINYPDAINSLNRSGDSAKNRIPALFTVNAEAKAQALVAQIDLSSVLENRKQILEDIERDHPELQADMATSSGDASGRALRVAREKVEARVVTRRAGYDAGLKRALQMAISIGAMKGYPGFEAFTAESYAKGELDFQIGPRPVFSVDVMSNIEETQARATALKTLTDSGIPLDVAMEESGFSEERIKKAMASKAKEEQARTTRLAKTVALRFPEVPASENDNGPLAVSGDSAAYGNVGTGS